MLNDCALANCSLISNSPALLFLVWHTCSWVVFFRIASSGKQKDQSQSLLKPIVEILLIYLGGRSRLLVDVPRNISMFQSCSSSPKHYFCISHRSYETFPAVLQMYSSIYDSSNRHNEHLDNFPVFLTLCHSLPSPLTLFLHCFLVSI